MTSSVVAAVTTNFSAAGAVTGCSVAGGTTSFTAGLGTTGSMAVPEVTTSDAGGGTDFADGGPGTDSALDCEGTANVDRIQFTEPPPMVIDPDNTYTATLVLAKGGEIVIDLFAADAPVTVNNFVFLARAGYYDGVTFHRVISGFVAQTGDRTGTGAGGPGYWFDNELSPDLRHDGPGVVSMANAGIQNGRGTNGSQFFITYASEPFLDGHNPDGSPKDCAAPMCNVSRYSGRWLMAWT